VNEKQIEDDILRELQGFLSVGTTQIDNCVVPCRFCAVPFWKLRGEI